ncbi:MAG: hypothetical protein M3N32_10050 [Actinomycetota bacterium]|nr:hypothetical protein [Actinomycetota bacterium]
MRRWTPLLVVLMLTGALMGGAAPRPASAQSPLFELIPAFDTDLPTARVTTASTILCTIYASDPDKPGLWIHGEGSQQCSLPTQQGIVVSIQMYRGLGYWLTKRSVPAEGRSDFLHREVFWGCDGTGAGWQTYRIVTSGWFRDVNNARYRASVQSQNYGRFFCR